MKNNIEKTKKEITNLQNKLIKYFEDFTHNDITTKVYFYYNEFNVEIQHKTEHRNKFATLDFTLRKNIEYSFIHGSGDWNTSNVDTQLEITLNIFNIIKNIFDDINTQFPLIREIFKKRSALTLEIALRL